MTDMNVLKDAVINGDQNLATKITLQALEEGIAPEVILQQGLIAGMYPRCLLPPGR